MNKPIFFKRRRRLHDDKRNLPKKKNQMQFKIQAPDGSNHMDRIILTSKQQILLVDKKPMLCSCIVQSEDIIQHIEASLGRRHQMEHLKNKKGT